MYSDYYVFKSLFVAFGKYNRDIFRSFAARVRKGKAKCFVKIEFVYCVSSYGNTVRLSVKRTILKNEQKYF